MKLTDSQMLELLRARESLAAYKDKVQPYPPEPEEDVPAPMPQVIEHIVRHSNMGKKEFDLLQQTVLKVDYLEKLLKAKKKTQQNYEPF